MKNNLDGMSLLSQILLIEYMSRCLSNISITIQQPNCLFHIFLSVDLSEILTIELDGHTAFQNTVKDTAFIRFQIQLMTFTAIEQTIIGIDIIFPSCLCGVCAFQNGGPEALLALMNAFAAQGIVSHAVALIQKERHFFLALFAHS